MTNSVSRWKTILGLLLVLCTSAYAQSEEAPAPIKLLPHQQFPIDYLLQHPEIKGLLINHFMGTGKTFLALGAGEQLHNAKVLILGPRFLQANWLREMARFGLKDPSRYEFVSYEDAPEKLKKRDLSDTLLILDEGHNLVRYFKSTDLNRNRLYSELYVQLRSAQRILVLTGTPIYNNEHDLAYVLNLVSGENLFSFNEQQFMIENTRIMRGRSFWRGYLAESLILQAGLPTILGFAAAGVFASFIAFPVAAGVASLIIPVTAWTLAPIEKYRLRQLDPDKFVPVAEKYVSFYEVKDLDMSEFPAKTITVQSVSYNQRQLAFFLNFIDGTLTDSELSLLLKENQIAYTPLYIQLNSSNLQNNMRFSVGTGREIGNLSFALPSGEMEEAPKFIEILKTMQQAEMPKTVIYSSYYENGIVPFAEFLKRHGLEGQFRILHPDMEVADQTQVVKDYNEGKFKILLLHPDITEGISLKETRQFHLLEPVLNRTVFEQVVGRAVRFQSHSTLPEKERVVDVFVWRATINDLDPQTLVTRYENWREKYAELNNWSSWGRGLAQVDKNHERKLMSPDDFAIVKLDALADNIEALRTAFRGHSIEKSAHLEGDLGAK